MLAAALVVGSSLLDTPEVEKQLGIKLSNEWTTLGAVALFIVLVGVKVISLEKALNELRDTRPKLSLKLPPKVTIQTLDDMSFSVGVSNGPNSGAAIRPKVTLMSVDPPVSSVTLPSVVNEGYEDDINPDDMRHFVILRTQHGTQNMSGASNPTKTILCDLGSGFFHLDLLHGSLPFTLRYRVTANNMQKGMDFSCAVSRRTLDNEWNWDFEWQAIAPTK